MISVSVSSLFFSSHLSSCACKIFSNRQLFSTSLFVSASLMSSSASASPSSFSPSTGLVAGKTRLGFIGLGVMGNSICTHLMKSSTPQYPTIVYNRTLSKTKAVQQLGATVVDSPEEVAANCDILFTMLGFPSDVRSVYLGDQSSGRAGVLSHLSPGSIVIDMTTSEPTLAVTIHKKAKELGISAFDAPVSGGDIGAREARLSIMVGGDEGEALQCIMPLFSAMGKTITYCGTAGKGQHTKMVNQILIATNMIGVCEGLLYATKAGLSCETVLSAISGGAAASWSLSNLAPRILRKDFEPGFYVEHFLKDLNIAMQECNRMHLALPGLSLANSLYNAVIAQGYPKKGSQALFLALETLNRKQSM